MNKTQGQSNDASREDYEKNEVVHDDEDVMCVER